MNCQIYRIEKVGKCLSIILQIKKGQNGKKNQIALLYKRSRHFQHRDGDASYSLSHRQLSKRLMDFLKLNRNIKLNFSAFTKLS